VEEPVDDELVDEVDAAGEHAHDELPVGGDGRRALLDADVVGGGLDNTHGSIVNEVLSVGK
jgi:hypothetical protein